MKFATHVKEILFQKIKTMARNRERFCKDPNKDFTRDRKLDFTTMMTSIILMGGGSIQGELYEYLGFEAQVATTSAFVQQRGKLLPEAFSFLFNELNSISQGNKLYKGYRLIAGDGSDLAIAADSNDTENYFQTRSDSKGYSKLHLNACYDLCNRKYVDAIIQSGVKFHEREALNQMIDRYPGEKKTIFIADRGYEGYNLMAHAHEKGVKFLIRIKDRDSSNSIIKKFALPDMAEFDVKVSTILTRNEKAEFREAPQKYRLLHRESSFDYLDEENEFYPIAFRIVRFKITDDTYECLVTNLSEEDFSSSELKKLYHMRWGIETSFRELKYAIGLTSFHAKKTEYIKQEIFARLILYNICESIMLNVVIHKKKAKHLYQINHTQAFKICRKFLRHTADIHPPDVEELIAKNLLPIRPGRKAPRKVKHQSAVSFLYRVS